MQEFVKKLFSQNNSNLQINLFDGWHFLYLFIIFGGSLALTLIFKGKSDKAKTRVIRLFAYLTIGLYVADFFIMPLSDTYEGISIYKLPFNICTLMAVLVPFVEFNKRLSKIKKPVVALSVTASMMWMCYPGSALGGQPPFSYVIFQTFMYHGFLFTWGVLNLSLGKVVLKLRSVWQEFVGILMIFVWAKFGNAVYEPNKGDYNWFFIEKSIFPFISDKIIPIVVIITVFACVLAVYGIYFLVRGVLKLISLIVGKIKAKKTAKKEKVEEVPEESAVEEIAMEESVEKPAVNE